MVEFIISSGCRLDVAVSSELKISRNQASNLICDGFVSVALKTITKPSFKPNLGDTIVVKFAQPKPSELKFEVNFDVPIVYEDDDLLVLNKPPHLVVHGAPSVQEATLVEWLVSKNFMLSNLNGDQRAGIVHRLDKETSGAIVVAKTNFAHAALSEQLSDKSMGRIYLALSDLALKQECIIDRPIARSPSNRLKNAIVAGGREAKSAFANLLLGEGVNLIAAKLFTGRTHQIRVHLASINRHILGDNLYGFKSEKGKINRVMLHAYMLYFIHPRTKELMKFVAPIYDDFMALIDKNFTQESFNEKTDTTFIDGVFSDISGWMRL